MEDFMDESIEQLKATQKAGLATVLASAEETMLMMRNVRSQDKVIYFNGKTEDILKEISCVRKTICLKGEDAIR